MNGFTLSEPITIAGGSVDRGDGTVTGKPDTKLSPLELKLLVFLSEHPNEIFRKEDLLEAVWALPAGSESRTVFTTIERLRKKIERDPKSPRHVLTIGREGYTFRPLDAPIAQAPARAPEDLVGRRGEMGLVARHLSEEGAIVTLHGPGGVGKTRLASEIARSIEDRPVWTAHLEGARGGDDALARIARALDLPVDSDPSRTLARVARAGRAGILLLDGADHITPDLAALITQMGPSRPRILVTSRAPLSIAGERLITLEPLGEADGIALFTLRAGERRRCWIPDAGEQALIRALVRRLDGLPLAIEFAASWSGLLDPGEILARIDAVSIAALGAEQLPERHRTLDAVIRWSWEALGADEQRALASLVPLRSPATATEVASVIDPSLERGLVLLERLRERSLVQVAQGPSGRRFYLLDTVRTFATARAGERREELAAARARHARHFGSVAKSAVDASELGHIHTLHSRISEIERDLEDVIAVGLPLDAGFAALALGSHFRVYGPVGRWREIAACALARGDLPPWMRVRIQLHHAMASRYTGDSEGALRELTQAEALAEREAPGELGGVLQALGIAHFHSYRVDIAKGYLERSLQLRRASGDLYAEGVLLAELGTIAWRSHHLDEAARLYREALQLLRRTGSRHAEAVYLGNLGVVEMTQGRYEIARATLTEALRLNREIGSDRFEVQSLTNLGLLAARLGDPAEARARWEEALPLVARSGDRRDEAILHLNLASSALEASETARARRHLDVAEDTMRGLDLALHRADAALLWSELLRAEGDLALCWPHLDEAKRLAEAHDLAAIRTRERAARGLVALSGGDRPAAESLLEEAERMFASSEASDAEVAELIQLREGIAG